MGVPGVLKRKAAEAFGAEPLREYGADEFPPLDEQPAASVNVQEEVPVDNIQVPQEETATVDGTEKTATTETAATAGEGDKDALMLTGTTVQPTGSGNKNYKVIVIDFIGLGMEDRK